MDRARIAELLQPFLSAPIGGSDKPGTLSSEQLDNISTYIDILLRWNVRINLTAIRDPEQIITRHFGESFFAARVLYSNLKTTGQPSTTNDQRPGLSVADLGSGAGFPGIPLKLWNPSIHLTLIESNHKKATFLREVARALTLTDIDIQTVRAETLPLASFDLVTMRAVERFADVLPIAASLVTPRGRLALLIGTRQLDATRSSLPNLSWPVVEPIPASRSRILTLGYRNS